MSLRFLISPRGSCPFVPSFFAFRLVGGTRLAMVAVVRQ